MGRPRATRTPPEDVVPSDRFRSGGRRRALFLPPGRSSAAAGEARFEALVEANVAGIHAYQMGSRGRTARRIPACWPQGAAIGCGPRGARRPPERRSSKNDPAVVKAWAAGQGLGFRPREDLSPSSPRGLRSRRDAAGQRLHHVPGRRGQGPAALPGARDREPLPDGARGRARRRPAAGALRLLHRSRSARVRRPARLAGDGRGPPGGRASARGQELRVAGGPERRGMADRGAEDLELGREEPAHPRCARPGQGAAGRA